MSVSWNMTRKRGGGVFLLCGRQCNRDEIPARGLATDIELVRVGAEMRRIVVDPGDGAADLIGEHHKAAADILHPRSGTT